MCIIPHFGKELTAYHLTTFHSDSILASALFCLIIYIISMWRFKYGICVNVSVAHRTKINIPPKHIHIDETMENRGQSTSSTSSQRSPSPPSKSQYCDIYDDHAKKMQLFELPTNVAMRNLANIYILELNGGKYYIGRSYIPQNRIDQHRGGELHSAKWVTQWGFKGVLTVFPERNIFEEDYYTKLFMHKYGIEHVRGGTYFTSSLTPTQIAILQKEFDSALHRCFKCGDLFTRRHRCNFATANTYCYYCMGFGHRMKYCPKLQH